jgi:translocation and assembly module TamA
MSSESYIDRSLIGHPWWRATLRSLILLVTITLLGESVARAADPQSYKVEIASTGNHRFDSTLKATSQLVALRSTPVSPFALVARARGDLERLKTVLDSFGYYQGSVSITIDGHALDDSGLADALNALPKKKDALCKVTFDLGPLYHIGSITIDGQLPEVARNTLALTPGSPAVASEILAGGARLLTALENHAYAFAKVDAPRAYEDPEQHLLNLTFHVVPGAQAEIGDIHFQGLKRMKETILRRRLLLHTGQPYSAIAIEQARKDLLVLGVFAAVNVHVGEAPDAQGRVSVIFQMQERLRHAVSLNGGYSSDLGGSVGVTWTDRNVFGNAEQLSVSAQVINLGGGTATTGIGYDDTIKYIIPEFAHRDQQLQFAVSAIKQDLQAYDQTAESSGVTLTRKLSSQWSASVGISAEHETIIQEMTTHVYTLFALPLGVLFDSTGLASPLLDPTRGERASFGITPTLSRGQPNTAFFIGQASFAQYFDLHSLFHTESGRSVIALRAIAANAFGASAVDEDIEVPCSPPSTTATCYQEVRVPNLPPDQRFYAGGSGTVRGYRYQSVGLQFPDGNPVGGTAMAAFNVEFRQRFGESWGAAFFADAGEASENLSPLTGLFHSRRCSSSAPLEGTSPAESSITCWAVGVGAGARYYTPIGPIRLDFAVPTYRRSNDDRFEVYIGLGQAF